MDAIAKGTVDLSMVVPAYTAFSARIGAGMFEGEPHPELRALGVLPQDDRLVLAVGAEHGIASFADLRSKRTPLRIATSWDDGVNTIGYGVNRAMAAHGISREEFLGWGGTFLEDDRPFPPLRWYIDGSADAVFHEAIMTPPWQEVGVARPTNFIPMEDAALTTLEAELGWPRAILRAGYLPGLEEDSAHARLQQLPRARPRGDARRRRVPAHLVHGAHVARDRTSVPPHPVGTQPAQLPVPARAHA